MLRPSSPFSSARVPSTTRTEAEVPSDLPHSTEEQRVCNQRCSLNSNGEVLDWVGQEERALTASLRCWGEQSLHAPRSPAQRRLCSLLLARQRRAGSSRPQGEAVVPLGDAASCRETSPSRPANASARAGRRWFKRATKGPRGDTSPSGSSLPSPLRSPLLQLALTAPTQAIIPLS